MTQADKNQYEKFLKETGNGAEAMRFWMRWKALDDLYFLMSEIFNMKDAKGKNGRKRLDPRIHRQLCKEICSKGSKLILYPRNHMKTTFVKGRIVQLILSDPMVRIGLWSKTATLVKKELKSVRNMIANPILRELFPELIPDPQNNFSAWDKVTDSQLTVWRDKSADFIPQEAQLEAWGTEGTVTGHHYDYHFYDDVIDKKSVKTAEQIEKTLSWWREMQNVKELDAEECMTGTRKHQMDIYNTIIREQYFETVIQHRAEVAGRAFYAFYSMDDLTRLKRTLGNYDYSLEMMNDPLPESERLFRAPFPLWRELPKEEMKSYISADFAYSEKKWADFTGIAIGKVPVKKPNCIYYVEAFKVKLKTNEIAELLVQKCAHYRPRRMGIESSMHNAIQYILDMKFKQYENEHKVIIRPEIVVIPHKKGNMSKADKIDATLGSFVRDQRALFNPNMTELFNQMEFFNKYSDKNDDDILDAAAMLIPTVENFAPFHWENFQPDQASGFTIEKLRNPNPAGTWESLWARPQGALV